MVDEYEVSVCYRVMRYAFLSAKIKLSGRQIKRLLSFLFSSDVLEAVRKHMLDGTRPEGC